jgi:threonine dehydrogenase-like Zn-dependent dehydrogenase
MAKRSGAIPINYEEEEVEARLRTLTDGRGPHSCIDAVGLEAHGHGIDAFYDKVMQAIRMEMDRTHALRQMIRICRNGGTISIPGVYLGFVDKFPLGIAFSKGLNFRMGQTHVQRYMKPLLEKIIANEIDPEFVISHRVGLSEAANAYKMFAEKLDNCTKFVLDPDS